MTHYSCDRCKCTLDSQRDLRYVVRLEAQAVMEPLEPEELEDDRDHLLEVHEILERLEAEECDAAGDEIYQRHSFNLCADCYREYIKNPLGREVPVSLGFSAN